MQDNTKALPGADKSEDLIVENMPVDDLERDVSVLVVSVLVISACALAYELLISSLSSYLLGSSILHFSLTIGLFMFFMGVGSYLSKFVNTRLLDRFILVENIIGLLGGFSAFLLYLSFSLTEHYYLVALILIGSISSLVGLEIPLVVRIVRRKNTLKEAVANVLAVDYVGALIASILFPLIFLPYLGLMKTSFLIGIVNIAIAVLCAVKYRTQLHSFRQHIAISSLSVLLLGAGFLYSFSLVSFFEKFIYQDQIIYSAQTPYQRIILTKFKNDIRLFLNGSIQFSSIDEHRYHEPLVHIALSQLPNPEQVLILGGGDGMVAREVLRYPKVQSITIVDIDSQMTDLAKTNPLFVELNDKSLEDPRVSIINADAYKYIENTDQSYSAVIMDLPDPNDPTLGRLYTKEFFELIKKHLAADGIVVTQSSSPYFARTAFWSINNTLEEVFSSVQPFVSYVPSFGLWGFNMAANRSFNLEPEGIPSNLRFLNAETLPGLFVFDSDISELPAEVNRLDNQILVKYYEQSFHDWN